MSRAILLSILILMSFIAATGQQATVQVESGAWINVTPDKAGFTILMPAKPDESTSPVEGRPGTENHTLTLETQLAGYVVSYVQFPDEVTDPETIKLMLEHGRDGGVAAMKGELISEKELKLGEYFGREWTVKIPGGISSTSRAYWVKRRLFQTVFIVGQKDTDTPELIKTRQQAGTKFLDSFKLSPEAGN